ncbi:MAG: O-antigen ligase family protein, partial [Chloroflexota bacterium]
MRAHWPGLAAGIAMLAGAMAYVLGPFLPLALGGAGLYVGAAAIRPDLALALVIVSVPFFPLAKSLAYLPFSPTEFLILGCLAGWLAREAWFAWRSGTWPRPRLDRLDWPLLLFLLGALAATFAAENLGTHLRSLRVIVVEPVVLYWLIRRLVKDETRFLALIDALVLAGVAVSVYAIYQYLFTTDTIVAEGVARARAIYGSPNNLGLFLGRVVPICACLAVWGTQRRALYTAALLPIGLALALTFSIGAWLGVAVAMFVATIAARKYRLALAVLAGLALAFAAGSLLDLQRITLHLSPDSPTWRWRIYVWQAGWEMAKDHPLLGIGLDNFYTLYQRYMLPEAWPEPGLSHPHNLVLDFWLSTGLLGLVGGLWFIARLWRGALSLWQQAARQEVRAAGLGLAASTAGLVAHGLLDNSYFLADLAIVFWLMQGLVATQQSLRQSDIIHKLSTSNEDGKEESRRPGRTRLTVP